MDNATREALMGVSTATLTTVLAKRGLSNTFLSGVVPLNPAAPKMVGPAYTLRTIPSREDIDTPERSSEPDNPQRRGIEACPPGAVFIVDSRGDPRAASAGGILTRRLMVRGVAGFVTDGGLRDSPDIARFAMPTYHQRPTAPANYLCHRAVEAEVPIACGGVAVYPGDIVVGDGEGVVIVPAGIAAEVAEAAVEQTALEDWIEARVADGESIVGLYPPSEENRARFAASRGR